MANGQDIRFEDHGPTASWKVMMVLTTLGLGVWFLRRIRSKTRHNDKYHLADTVPLALEDCSAA